jgi:hypothetical protein
MLPLWLAKRLLDSNQVQELELANPLHVQVGSRNLWHVGSRIRFNSSLARDPIAGYGVASDPDVARLKALMEAIERTATASVSAHGFASHFSVAAARQSAFVEMIERDAWIRFQTGIGTILWTLTDRSIFLGGVESRWPGAHVVFAAQRDMACVPFGLGADANQERAIAKAIAELGLSLVRHRSKDCSTDATLYGQLHTRTRSDSFQTKLFGPHPKPRASSFGKPSEGGYSHWSGCHRWPIQVVAAHSDEYLVAGGKPHFRPNCCGANAHLFDLTVQNPGFPPVTI